MPFDAKTLKQYEKWGVPPPTSEAHGTTDEIRANLRPLMPTSWRQEGNKLIGETEAGPLVNFIPTDHILVGTDDQGLPIFRKIG